MFEWLKPAVRQNRKYREQALQILARAKSQETLSDAELQARYQAVKGQAERGWPQRLEVLALVAVAGHRHLGFWAHPEQIWGALALIDRNVVEMRTGEGKTFMAAFAAAWHALEGQGVHVVTANAYLVERDAHELGPVYGALGLSVGTTLAEQPLAAKAQAYTCDVTYGTSTELGFDYLRDQLAVHPEQQVQRSRFAAIVDEVDSLLIDEARTPLVISGLAQSALPVYQRFEGLAQTFQGQGDDPHFVVDEKTRRVELTERGYEAAEQAFAQWEGQASATHANLYDPQHLEWFHHLDLALKAKAVLRRDVDYVVADGQVQLVDAHTGRIQPGRRWDHGLYQAVEVKEGLVPSVETTLQASMAVQQYFAGYAFLAGMTGTAATERDEFLEIYGLNVVEVPTHHPMIRVDHPDVICITKADKLRRVVEEIKHCHAAGRPVLVGTVSVAASEEIAQMLTQEGLSFGLLNAKNHAHEATIIAQAGKPGAITVATSMAGRGTDIILGGSKEGIEPQQWQRQHDEVVALGGLHVLGTERNDARRIDNQLRGRAGRQGDPGSSRFYLSMEDALLRIFASDWAKGLLKALGVQEGNTIESPAIAKQVERAQRQLEAHHFQSRKNLLQYDRVLHNQRDYFYTIRQQWLERAWTWDQCRAFLANAEVEGNPVWETLDRETVTLAFLETWDQHWRQHLERLALLRQGIHLRGMAQRQPLQEYQREGSQLFEWMERQAWQEAADRWSALARSPSQV